MSMWRDRGEPHVRRLAAWFVLALAGCGSGQAAQGGSDQTAPRAELRGPTPPVVRRYIAPRRTSHVTVDGRIDEASWEAAPWSESFTDIEGDVRPAPRFRTRVRMLWDDSALYVAAELEEPDLWATITRRDAVIFQDNDFELFVDPDGDTHRYFELEVNARGTPWDLFLPKPYRDGGHAVDAWNIEGLGVGVALDGTLNDPRDRDRGWGLELMIPWSAFADSGRTRAPPRDGDAWRVNFSRVEWDHDTVAGSYRKRTDPATGRPLPEHNWVWSPQGAINMHMPEMWGIVHFGRALPADSSADVARWALRRVYYAQRAWRRTHGAWATTLAGLAVPALPPGLTMQGAGDGWSARLAAEGTTWEIGDDGRVRRR
jgi:hypothetical protein